jgi:hypothetical protein
MSAGWAEQAWLVPAASLGRQIVQVAGGLLSRVVWRVLVDAVPAADGAQLISGRQVSKMRR